MSEIIRPWDTLELLGRRDKFETDAWAEHFNSKESPEMVLSLRQRNVV